MSYMKQNKHQQTLESAQYGLEISLKFTVISCLESNENIKIGEILNIVKKSGR